MTALLLLMTALAFKVLAALMLCTCVAVHAMIALHESNIAAASDLLQAAPGQVCAACMQLEEIQATLSSKREGRFASSPLDLSGVPLCFKNNKDVWKPDAAIDVMSHQVCLQCRNNFVAHVALCTLSAWLHD